MSDITLSGGWAWKTEDADKTLTVGTSVTATAEYTGADKGNYENETVIVTITKSECEHVAGEILYDETGEKEHTCTEDSKGHRECTKCGATIESGIVVKAAHKFSSEWTIDKAATTTEEGSKSHHCTVCDAKTDITVIPKITSGGSSGGGGSSSGGSSGGGAAGGAGENKTEGSDNTTTITNADGSITIVKTEVDANGNIVTTTTKIDTDGNVMSIIKKTVINNIAKNTTATVTVKTDGDGNVISAKASVIKISDSTKVSLSGKVLSRIAEAAGENVNVRITMTVKDTKGKTLYKVQADTNEIIPGETLYIYKLNTKTGKYTMVDAKAYKVTKTGNVTVNMTKKATYELVTAKESKAITKEILATVKPAKSSTSLSEDKKTSFKLSAKLDMDNVKSITYTTSKESIATVSKKGTITAVNAGSTTVKATVTLKNGTKKTIKMTIKVK